MVSPGMFIPVAEQEFIDVMNNGLSIQSDL